MNVRVERLGGIDVHKSFLARLRQYLIKTD